MSTEQSRPSDRASSSAASVHATDASSSVAVVPRFEDSQEAGKSGSLSQMQVTFILGTCDAKQ